MDTAISFMAGMCAGSAIAGMGIPLIVQHARKRRAHKQYLLWEKRVREAASKWVPGPL